MTLPDFPKRYDVVYPGHGIVVALFIMRAFPCASAALQKSEHGWPECVGASDVPGAGDGAYAGADLIRRLQAAIKNPDSVDTIDSCIALALSEWRRRVGPGTGNHEDQYTPGVAQAEQLLPLFRQSVDSWDWS